MLSLQQRIKNYSKIFPKYPKMYLVNDKKMEGVWYIGRSFKKGTFYGEYPTNYLERIYALFPDCENVLHLFSGIVRDLKGITFDINPDLKPDILGDVREIEKYFEPNSFDLIIADPPYEKKDFEKYGVKPFDKRKVIRSLHGILINNGFLVWLDLMIPPFSNKLYRMYGMIPVTTGTNCRVRVVTIFQKHR